MGDLNCASFVPPTYDLAISEIFTFGQTRMDVLGKTPTVVPDCSCSWLEVVVIGQYWLVIIGGGGRWKPVAWVVGRVEV